MRRGSPQLFNCGYGKGFSVREVLESLNEIITKDYGLAALNIIESPRRAGDPACLIADNQKLISQTDFAPQYQNLKTILKSAFEWEKTFILSIKIAIMLACSFVKIS